MSISRRTALKQFLILTGGVVLIPSCMQGDAGATTIKLKHLNVKAADEKLLAEFAETLIPATSSPGAKDLYLHHFAFTMLDDCFSPEDQKAFEQGLKEFDSFVRKEWEDPFVDLNAQQRTAVLERYESKKDITEDQQAFYKKIKNLLIHGYLTSQHYLTKVQVYELVPGRYRGCVPVTENSQAKKAA